MFQYAHPEMFRLLWLLPVFAGLLAGYWWWRGRAIKQLGAVDKLLPGFSKGRFWWKNSLLGVIFLLLVLALVNPQRGAKKQKTTQQSADVFIALDISQSMLCADVAPNRLELAKIFAEKLIKKLEGERIGLVFFAGSAFVQSPLSTDYTFLLARLRDASPDLIAEQGTAIPAALDLTQQSYDPEPGGGRAIIVLTDGENHDEDATSAAANLYDDGIIVHAVGVGTATGGPIPTGGFGASQYKRDVDGKVVQTRLEADRIAAIARSGGGIATDVTQGDAGVDALVRAIDGLQKRDLEVRSFAEFDPYFQWLLLPAILLLAFYLWLPWKVND